MHQKSKKEDIELPLIAKSPGGAPRDPASNQAGDSRKNSGIQSSKSKYLDTNPISRLFFFWVSRIMKTTGDTPFQQNMHYDLRHTEECGWMAARFISEWGKAKDKKFAFLRTQYNSFASLIWTIQILALLGTLLNFTGPILVSKIITYSQSENPQFEEGVHLALLFIVSRLCIITVTAQSNTISSLLLVRIVKATRSLIFTKFLKLPLKRSQEFASGDVINYMIVDAEKMSKIFTVLPQIIQLPIMMVIAIYLVYQAIGFAFIGVGITMVVLISTLSYLSAQMNKRQKEIMISKDARVKRTNEILNGIKYIKMSGSELKFMEILKKDRNHELFLLQQRYKITYVRLFLIWMTFTCLTLSAFGIYLLSGEELTPQKAFVVISTLMVVQSPIFMIGGILNEITEGKASLDRIQKFLYAEEVTPNHLAQSKDIHPDIAVKVVNGNFAWIDEAAQAKAKQGKTQGKGDNSLSKKQDVEKKKPVDVEQGSTDKPNRLILALKNLNLEVKKGSFVAILGDVGSGKSSLFHALFGEMMHEKENPPSVYVNGSVAYVSQKPWVLNDTVRDNILFDKPYNEASYKEALRGSCLEQDLEILIKKDQTEIGEKGVNLSGGQKARIALARAIYSDKDIYLLDDPLSAVDAHVGKYILEECLAGQLVKKTRILVTHKLESLPYVDYIYIFKGGEIVAEGDKDTIKTSSYYLELEQKSFKTVEDIEKSQSPKRRTKTDMTKSKPDQVQEKIQNTPTRKKSSVYEKEDQKKLYEKLMLNEDRKIGAVEFKTWKTFFSYFGNKQFVTLLFACNIFVFHVIYLVIVIIACFLQMAQDYWIAYWSSRSLVDSEQSNSFYYFIYLIIGLTSAIVVYFRIRMVYLQSLEVNRKLHNEMFYNIIRAPINLFFDRVPLGRLINRFTADLSIFDVTIPFTLGVTFSMPFFLLSKFLMAVFAGSIWILPLIALFFYIGIKIQKKYLNIYREVFRLSRITATPVTSLFTESLDGLTHIRSGKSEESFMKKYFKRQNESMKNEILVSGLQGWFSFRINLASLIIIAPSITAAVLFAKNFQENENPGLIGLLITYLLGVSSNLIMTLELMNSFESNLISFERCKAFTNVDVEKDPDTKLPVANYSYNWPSRGEIEFKNYYVKYRPTLPYVLKDVSLKIQGGEKIGVVGRTGSGKSTLFLSILRILEAQTGQLFIDDVNVGEVGLDDLRQKITIIPQDPLLYKGNVKTNLDLLGEFTDDQIWDALEKVRMKDKFINIGLTADIKEGGENLSAGERQLMCIGRAILKKNKIILIDEATSSIDNVTEEAILEAIHNNFKDCTVITIAHRLKTIISSDKVLFMADGQVMEFDSPNALLEKTSGHFYKLWNEYEAAHE